jgi:hypothetical protein
MRIWCPICQWCDDSSRIDFLSKKDFCDNGYCEKRYLEENNKLQSLKNKTCAFCYTERTRFNWSIGDNSFCNGKCVDHFDVMQTNSELNELKLKEKQLRDNLKVIENSIKELIDRVGPFK